jgi:hypothetical protein
LKGVGGKFFSVDDLENDLHGVRGNNPVEPRATMERSIAKQNGTIAIRQYVNLSGQN